MGKPTDSLPLWVADMDFACPQPVLDALHHRVEHGIFGYTDVKDDYYQAVAQWFSRRFGWQPQSQWLVKTPGVVFAIAIAVRALTEPGDAVLIQTPVYYPFARVVRDNGRTVVESPLHYQDHRYTIDFADFEEKILQHHVKLFILCSPHNPVGRVWTLQELQQLGAICQRHGVRVVSDEIHCDFTLPGHTHHIFLQANPDMAEQTVICTAPSKTFNLAGLQVSNIWIPSDDLRAAFEAEISRIGASSLNTLGLTACQAAYEQGEPWLTQCRAYMEDNLSLLRAYLQENLPKITLVEPEGTYFAWLDCSALGLESRELDRRILQDGKLWLDAGHIFGRNGGQFQRVVLACTHDTLTQALERLKSALA
jgi:cystathionine beta-lyase